MEERKNDFHIKQLTERRENIIQDDKLTKLIESSLKKNKTIDPEFNFEYQDSEELDWMDSVYFDNQSEKEYQQVLYEKDEKSKWLQEEYYSEELERYSGTGFGGNNRYNGN